MAAITNRDNWKQTWMQRAERITDVWDIIKAWCGRSAEVVLSICMFASIIGVLPGIHYWDFMNNVILSIQIIMLDMGGFALNTMAEHARDQGQDQAATKAERMATFLIGLVIATIALITIGQLSAIAGDYAALVKTIVGYVETGLILVRVISTVQYIHVIHSLRGSTLQPTHGPIPDTRMDELEGKIETILESLQRVHSDAPAMDTALVRTTIIEEIRANFPLFINSVDSTYVATGQIDALAVSTLDTLADDQTEEAFTLDSADTEQRIRALLIEDSSLSGRAIAARLGCSPTTANKWKARIEKGM